jgi:hypothetical protein
MQRFLISVLVLFLFSSCDQRWFGTIIKKRQYLKGYYLHVPSKKATPIAAYPKPSQYPTSKPTPAVVQQNSNTTTNTTSTNTTSTSTSTTVSQATSSTTIPSGGLSNSSAVGSSVPNTNSTVTNTSSTTTVVNKTVVTDTNLVQTQPTLVDSIPKDSVLVAKTDTLPPTTNSGGGLNFPSASVLAVLQMGIITGPQGSSPNFSPLSFSMAGAVKLVQPLNKKCKLTGSLFYQFSRYFINKKPNRISPLTSMAHDKEHLNLHELKLETGFRYQLPKKENQVETIWQARWLEANLYGTGMLLSAHVMKDYNRNLKEAEYARSVDRLRGLNYVRRWNWGIGFRAGNETVAVFGNCRVSQLIKWPGNEGVLQAQGLTLGLELMIGG